MYVLEAQLALLLRLAGAGGPGGRMGSAKALQDAAAVPYLCRCVPRLTQRPGGGQQALEAAQKKQAPEIQCHTCASELQPTS